MEFLNHRQSCPGAGDGGYSHQPARPHHRPDPDNPTQGFHSPFYGARSKCFAVASRHDLDDPRLLARTANETLNGVNSDNHATVLPRHARSFPEDFWQMIEENGRSRVYLGVHWMFDPFAVDSSGAMDLSRNLGGVRQGLPIAQDIFSTGMKESPVGPRT